MSLTSVKMAKLFRGIHNRSMGADGCGVWHHGGRPRARAPPADYVQGPGSRRRDLPLNFHPAATRASAETTAARRRIACGLSSSP